MFCLVRPITIPHIYLQKKKKKKKKDNNNNNATALLRTARILRRVLET